MFKLRKKIDQKIASKVVGYFSKTSITPNQVTTLSLLMASFAAVFFSFGIYFFSVIGSILFIFAKFLDNLDGKLAREKNMRTTFGWYYDYFADTAAYILMFVGISAGISNSTPGAFEINLFNLIHLDLQNYLLFSAIIASLINTILGLFNKKVTEWPESEDGNLDDAVYLIGPITWLGFINFFFLISTVGSVLFVIYNLRKNLRK
tara:strand:+ start:9174 stop:9788 length:615 start_codon:yes stop_codon:yes gene_type:complete